MNYSTFLFKDNFNKIKKFIPIILILISTIEIIMIIYASFCFNLKSKQNISYLICYIILLLSTIYTLVIIKKYLNNTEAHILKIKNILEIYQLIIILWSIVISSLDSLDNNYPIVFVTIIFTIPLLFGIKPKYLNTLTIIGAVIISMVYTIFNNTYAPGFYINLSVAEILNIFISHKAYNALKVEFESLNELKALALIDELTGINNRRALDERLINENENNKVIVMIDIDDFKIVNDTKGHKEGDECLKFIASSLSSVFSSDDVYRFGGDEYTIVCDSSVPDVVNSLENLSSIIKNINPKFHYLSISAGVYSLKNTDTSKEAIKKADNALYQAKKNGKGRVFVYKEN